MFAYSSQSAVANQLVTPTRHIIINEINPQLGNDVFFQIPRSSDIIQSQLRTQIVNELFLADEKERWGDETVFPGNSINVQDFSGIQQLSNQSDDLNSIFISQRYHDLMNGSAGNLDGTNLLENIILLFNEYYGFTFEVRENQVFDPLVLDIEIMTDWYSPALDIYLINPDGTFDRLYDSIIAEVDNLIPIVPTQSGIHQILMRPASTDILVNQLGLLNDFPVERIDNGCVKTYTGTRPKVFFYELVPSNYNEGDIGSLHVDGFVDQNVISTGSVSSAFFGFGEVRVHNDQNQFGDTLPANPFHYGPTIVSVVTQPPTYNNDEVTIEGQGFNSNYYDLDIGFWGDFTPATPLMQGREILISTEEQFFTLEVEETSIVHFEDDYTSLSYGSRVYFDTMDGSDSIYCTTLTCNISPDTLPSQLTILEPGQYFVRVYQPLDGAQPIANLNLFPLDPLQTNEDTTLNTQLNTPLLLDLPADGFVCDGFVFEYTGTNSEASFEVRLFDNEGNFVGSQSDFTFNSYTNDTSGITFATPPTNETSKNLNGGYLWINQNGNRLLNNSLSNPLAGPYLETDDEDTFFPILIERYDSCSASELTDEEEVFQGQFLGNVRFLNVTKNSTIAYLEYKSAEGGNRLILETTNFSMSVVNLNVAIKNNWITGTEETKIIDGVYHYFVFLEFGTLNATDFGIEIVFDKTLNGNTFNGTLSTSVETSGYFILPDLILGHLAFTDTDNGQVPRTLQTNVSVSPEFPFRAVGAVVGIVAVAAAGFLGFRRFRKVTSIE